MTPARRSAAATPEASRPGAPIDVSLALLEALHGRWVLFLRSLTPDGWQRAFQHAEWGRVTIEDSLTMYSWHCRHHAAHIELGKG